MYLTMNIETASRLRGEYNGSLFEPLQLKNGMFACTIDNLHNPAFISIWEELAKLEIVDTVEYPQIEYIS